MQAILFAILTTASFDSFAADILRTDLESQQWNLAPVADYLRETGAELTVEEIVQSPLSDAFNALGADDVNFGILHGAYWLRFTIANPRPHRTTYYVELDNPRIRRADFYVPGATTLEARQWSGSALPFNDRSMPYRHAVFRVTLDPGQEQVVYLRAYHEGSFRFNVFLWEVDAFVFDHTLRTGLFGMFYGSLLIMLGFNMILFVLFHDRSFFLLSVIITSTGLYMLAYQCIDSQYFWPDSANLIGNRLNFIFGIGLCGLFFFSRDVLRTARNAPRWDSVYRIYGVLSLLLCLSIVVGGVWSDWLLHFVGGTAPIILLGGAIFCVRQGHRYAWSYLIAWGFLFSMMVPFAILGTGLIPISFLAEHGAKIAFPITLTLNSIALWQRFRELQEEHSANLERQVEERTKELTESLENVKTLHGLIPICSTCKNIRDDQGYWTRVETYIHDHSEADFTHGICPKCAKKLYGFSIE